MENANLTNSMSRCQQHPYVVLHEYVWLHPTGNTQAEYVLIGLTSIRIEMKSSDILSVGLTAAWKRTNFRPSVSIQSPPPQQISRYREHSGLSARQYCNDQHAATHISAAITGEPWACSGQEAIM